jgi:hypothetical protein
VRYISLTPLIENHISIYPNPVAANQFITFGNDWNESMNVSIFSSDGKFVGNKVIDNKEPFPIKLARGIYFYSIDTKGQLINGKFIVE